MTHPAAPRARRVLFLNWRDTSHPEGGGSEVYVEQVAARLAARGDDVTLLCARSAGLPDREDRSGFTVIRRGGRLSVYLRAAMFTVSRRAEHPDVVVEVHNGVPFLAQLYARRPVLVLVHHVHREQWPVAVGPAMAKFGWWLESWLAPRVNRQARYVTVSDSTRSELVALGVPDATITVVRNGVTPPPDDAEPRSRSTRPTIAVVGRLVPHKQVELVIEAAAQLRLVVPGVQVLIVGDGWWHDRLQRLVTDLGLDDGTVRLLGHLDERAKHQAYAAAWLLAIPSLKEGWGLVVVEAAEHSTPSVGFRTAGGLNESIIDGVTGLLVDDVESFTNALHTLLDDEELRLRLGNAARTNAKQYTWDATAERFAELVDAVVATPQSVGQREP